MSGDRLSTQAGILLPLLATSTAMACFQLGAAAAKSLFPALGAEGTAALRLGLGALMLLAIARPWRNWPQDAPVLSLLGVGLAMAGAVTFFYLAVRTLPLGIAIPIQFLGPLAVAILGSRRASDLAWVILAAGGIWMLAGRSEGGASLDLAGTLFALAAAGSWAAYILLGQGVSFAFGRSAAALSASIATLVVLPFGVATAGSALLTPELLPLAALVALVSTVLPFTLEFYALPRLPARTFAIFTSLEPAFAVMSGFAFLDERLTSGQLIGVLAVMIAAAGAAWTSASTSANGHGAALID